MGRHTFTLPGLDPPPQFEPQLSQVPFDVTAQQEQQEVDRLVQGDVKGSKVPRNPFNDPEDQKILEEERKAAFKVFNVSEFPGFGERFAQGAGGDTSRFQDLRRRAEDLAFKRAEERIGIRKEIAATPSPAAAAQAFPELEEQFGPTAFAPEVEAAQPTDFIGPGPGVTELREEGHLQDPFNRQLLAIAQQRALKAPTPEQTDLLKAQAENLRASAAAAAFKKSLTPKQRIDQIKLDSLTAFKNLGDANPDASLNQLFSQMDAADVENVKSVTLDTPRLQQMLDLSKQKAEFATLIGDNRMRMGNIAVMGRLLKVSEAIGITSEGQDQIRKALVELAGFTEVDDPDFLDKIMQAILPDDWVPAPEVKLERKAGQFKGAPAPSQAGDELRQDGKVVATSPDGKRWVPVK